MSVLPGHFSSGHQFQGQANRGCRTCVQWTADCEQSDACPSFEGALAYKNSWRMQILGIAKSKHNKERQNWPWHQRQDLGLLRTDRLATADLRRSFLSSAWASLSFGFGDLQGGVRLELGICKAIVFPSSLAKEARTDCLGSSWRCKTRSSPGYSLPCSERSQPCAHCRSSWAISRRKPWCSCRSSVWVWCLRTSGREAWAGQCCQIQQVETDCSEVCRTRTQDCARPDSRFRSGMCFVSTGTSFLQVGNIQSSKEKWAPTNSHQRRQLLQLREILCFVSMFSVHPCLERGWPCWSHSRNVESCRKDTDTWLVHLQQSCMCGKDDIF